MLHRYYREKSGGTGIEKRPYLATLCDDLDAARRWRGQIESEIGQSVLEIQDKSLDAERVQSLNDAINKLIRERRHWDRRVVHLGGTRARRPPPGQDDGALEVNGYFYFGASSELPAVRELLARQREAADAEKAASNAESNEDARRRLGDVYWGTVPPPPVAVKEEERIQRELRARLAAEWEAEEGEDEPVWDEAFRKFEGVKPAPSGDEAAARIALERQKLDALQLLRGGAGAT